MEKSQVFLNITHNIDDNFDIINSRVCIGEQYLHTHPQKLLEILFGEPSLGKENFIHKTRHDTLHLLSSYELDFQLT